MMYVRIRKQENREYLVLTTRDKKRVKINLNRLKYKPIHAIQLIYSLSAGNILKLGTQLFIMKNPDGTFSVSEFWKYQEKEKEFTKRIKDGDEFRVAKTWNFGDCDFYCSSTGSVSVGDTVKARILDGKLYCTATNGAFMRIPFFALEKADEEKKEDFDYSKIIVDPSKLVKGKKYYTGDSVVSLLKSIRNKETQIFGKAKTLNERYLASQKLSERIQLGFTDSGFWYSLWYPAEEKYKPYDSSSIRLLHGYVIRKKDGKKMLISGYARLGDELLYIFFKGDPHNYTPKEMLADFTWEDGTPFGQEVKE